MPQPSSRAKDIRRAAAAVASLGTMGYFGIGVCIGVAAFIVYRYYHPQNSAVFLDPVQPPPGQDDDDDDGAPGPSNTNGISANSNVTSNQEGARSPENPISQWRNEVQRKRTSSQLRHRAIPSSRSADQSQPTNSEAGCSTPATSISLDSLTSTTATPGSRPLSPSPQVLPLLSGNDGSLLTNPWVDVVQLPSAQRSTSSPSGTTYTRRNRAATVTRYLDQYPESSSIPSVSAPTSQTSNSTQHTIRSTPQPGSQHLPAPPTRSPGDLIYEELLSDEGRSTLPLRSEMEIEWSSILSSGFPNFELPDLRFGGGGNTPDEPKEQRQ